MHFAFNATHLEVALKDRRLTDPAIKSHKPPLSCVAYSEVGFSRTKNKDLSKMKVAHITEDVKTTHPCFAKATQGYFLSEN